MDFSKLVTYKFRDDLHHIAGNRNTAIDRDRLPKILEHARIYFPERHAEKVYLHFNKPFYSIGQTCRLNLML